MKKQAMVRFSLGPRDCLGTIVQSRVCTAHISSLGHAGKTVERRRDLGGLQLFGLVSAQAWAVRIWPAVVFDCLAH